MRWTSLVGMRSTASRSTSMTVPLVVLVLWAVVAVCLGAGMVRTSQARTRPARPVDLALVLPRGIHDAGELTPEAVRAQLAAASSYWSEQTRGAVRFEVSATVGWYRSAHPCADGKALWAQAAAHFRGSGDQGRHLVIVVPATRAATAGCGYGFGTQGQPSVSDSAGGSASGGGTVFITNTVPSLLAHELGHNLGLGHASSVTCAGVQDGRYLAGRWAGGCAVREYDDLFDVMGYSSSGYGQGNLNVVHLDHLGLDPTAIRALGAGTSSVAIPPLSNLDAAGRGVKLVDPAGAVYYLEYRTATGRDAAAPRTSLAARPGLRILRTDPRLAGAAGSLELDATPPVRVGGAPAAKDYDRALPVGGLFTSASGQVSVRLDAANGSGARVTVHIRPGAKATLSKVGPATTRWPRDGLDRRSRPSHRSVGSQSAHSW